MLWNVGRPVHSWTNPQHLRRSCAACRATRRAALAGWPAYLRLWGLSSVLPRRSCASCWGAPPLQMTPLPTATPSCPSWNLLDTECLSQCCMRSPDDRCQEGPCSGCKATAVPCLRRLETESLQGPGSCAAAVPSHAAYTGRWQHVPPACMWAGCCSLLEEPSAAQLQQQTAECSISTLAGPLTGRTPGSGREAGFCFLAASTTLRQTSQPDMSGPPPGALPPASAGLCSVLPSVLSPPSLAYCTPSLVLPLAWASSEPLTAWAAVAGAVPPPGQQRDKAKSAPRIMSPSLACGAMGFAPPASLSLRIILTTKQGG